MLNPLDKRPDFELRSVVEAYRLPQAGLLCITAIHATVLDWLGHPLVAIGWFVIMLPVDFIVYSHAVGLLKRDILRAADVEPPLARLSFIRFMVIMSGAAVACLQRPGEGELVFLVLTSAVVSAGALAASGYRLRLILAGFGAALLGLMVGLSPLWRTPEFGAIVLGLVITMSLMGGMLRGVVRFAKHREDLSSERRQAVSDLLEARDQLEDVVDAKSVFLSTLSHEVRTPLNGVMGLAEVLARSSLSIDQREQVETILASGVMMRTILDDVLDAAKIEAGRMELSPAPTDLDLLFKQIARVWAAPAQLKGVAFAVDLDVGDALYNIDPVRLQQVINNLLSNAVKFTKAGGVRLSAEFLEGAGGSRRLRVAVQDTGIGLTVQACEKLFGHFVQADASVAGRFGGSGVGLYVSKNLISLMGGEIGVTSAVGEGSTFWFEIDVDTHEAAETPAEAQASSLALDVVAVDDNPTNRKVVKLLLESLGQICEIVEDGATALEALQVRPFDVVLLDLRMPGLSGDQTLARLRDVPGPNQRTPVVALTADAGDWTNDVARARGFDGFVSKPIDIGQLARALDNAGRGQTGRSHDECRLHSVG